MHNYPEKENGQEDFHDDQHQSTLACRMKTPESNINGGAVTINDSFEDNRTEMIITSSASEIKQVKRERRTSVCDWYSSDVIRANGISR